MSSYEVKAREVLSRLAPFGEILHVKMTDGYKLGEGPVDCLDILIRVKRDVEPSSLVFILRSMGYLVEIVKARGRRVRLVVYGTNQLH